MDGTANRERTRFGNFLREVGDELAADRARRVPSMTPVAADWRRLDKPTPPFPGESLRGLVARACQRQPIPNSWGVLQHLGLPHRNRILVSEHPGIMVPECAYALGVAEREVADRRYEETRSGRVSFFGMEIYTGRIEKAVRRFSPKTLRDPAARFHRAVWELKDIPFCLEGWDMLQDRCFCEGDGVIQGWTRTLTKIEECDRCGDPLHWLEPIPVPPEMQPALSMLTALVDPSPENRAKAIDRLPVGLRVADRAEIFRMLILMAHAVDPEAEEQLMEEPVKRLRGLHRACEIVSQWPEGWDQIRWPDGVSKGVVEDNRDRWFKLQKGYVRSRSNSSRRKHTWIRTKRTVDEAEVGSKVIGIRPAYELAQLDTDNLRAIWSHGLVTRHERQHGSRLLMAFDPDELERIAAAWHDRLDLKSVAYRLGLPHYGLEQLVAAGTLVADAPALPDTGPHFRPAVVRAFLSTIENNVSRHVKDPLPLQQVMTSIGGRAKPWGPVLALLHGGDLPFKLVDADRLVDRIRIAAGHVERVRALVFDKTDHPGCSCDSRMIKRDALEILHVSMTGERLLTGLASQGRNPKTYLVADIEKRAAKIISVPEIGALLGLDWSTAYHRVRRSGAPEIMPGGWDRQGVIDRLGSDALQSA